MDLKNYTIWICAVQIDLSELVNKFCAISLLVENFIEYKLIGGTF